MKSFTALTTILIFVRSCALCPAQQIDEQASPYSPIVWGALVWFTIAGAAVLGAIRSQKRRQRLDNLNREQVEDGGGEE